jgi:hypothetical protein
LLWGYPAAVAIAVGIFGGWVSLPRFIGVLVLAVGANSLVVPYWSDSVRLSSDGELAVGRKTIKAEDIRSLRFVRAALAGRTIRFRVLAFYTAERGDELPVVVIPLHGWLRRDKARMLEMLSRWLASTSAEMDDRTRAYVQGRPEVNA